MVRVDPLRALFNWDTEKDPYRGEALFRLLLAASLRDAGFINGMTAALKHQAKAADPYRNQPVMQLLRAASRLRSASIDYLALALEHFPELKPAEIVEAALGMEAGTGPLHELIMSGSGD